MAVIRLGDVQDGRADYEQPSYVAQSRTERAVLETLRSADGPGATTEQPIEGYSALTRTVPSDPLHAVAAARTVKAFAHRMMIGYAEYARGAGITWLALADALDVDPDEDDRAAAAFEMVSPEPSMRFDPRYAHWTCASCGKRVKDTGPYDGHPVDVETGHAEGCQRRDV